MGRTYRSEYTLGHRLPLFRVGLAITAAGTIDEKRGDREQYEEEEPTFRGRSPSAFGYSLAEGTEITIPNTLVRGLMFDYLRSWLELVRFGSVWFAMHNRHAIRYITASDGPRCLGNYLDRR
ncbi:hypothetical protein BHE74_00026820 [Ensete ventricosum]|nr:hypothetical protein GW17_00026534 [Ensete ventricosum]RWW65850.1 hypothetical protein BHE74_00026820 [Ensete ventricosum]RZS19118.1 hypothetical protein BHM03_00051469 [Ensete ventricosum]